MHLAELAKIARPHCLELEPPEAPEPPKMLSLTSARYESSSYYTETLPSSIPRAAEPPDEPSLPSGSSVHPGYPPLHPNSNRATDFKTRKGVAYAVAHGIFRGHRSNNVVKEYTNG